MQEFYTKETFFNRVVEIKHFYRENNKDWDCDRFVIDSLNFKVSIDGNYNKEYILEKNDFQVEITKEEFNELKKDFT